MKSLALVMALGPFDFGVTASSSAEAQSRLAGDAAIHAGTKHRQTIDRPKQEGRQITVQKTTPSWLTLGTDANVRRGGNYVTNTFNQPSPVEGTFSGYRGRERLIDQYGVPGVPLLRF